MKPQNVKTTPRIDSALAKSVNFEVTMADAARRSERRAWFVAFSGILMSLILAGGYFYFLPLKEKVPYLVMADAYTGTSTVARLTGDFNNQSVTTSEAINRSNIAHFILARESYDVAMMTLRDWKTVYTMSGSEVATAYTNLHANNNPSSPYNLYGRNRAIRVRILSITLIGGSKASAPKGATVRFQRSLYEKSTGAARPLDSKIATLEFSYKPNLYKQALAGVEGLPSHSFKNDQERCNAAASLAVDAKVSGLSRIDHVVMSTHGLGLFAVQGRMDDPSHHRIHVDKAQAAAQPIERSTQQMDEERQSQQQLQQQTIQRDPHRMII